MKFRWDKKYLYWGITIFLTIVASLLFYYLLFFGNSFHDWISKILLILSPIIYGLSFAFILTPLLNALENKLIAPILKKIRKEKAKIEEHKKSIRALSIFITFIIIIFIIYQLINLIIPQIITSITSIVNSFDIYMSNLYLWLEDLLDNSSVAGTYIMDTLTDSSDSLEMFLNSKILPLIQPLLKNLSIGLLSFLKSFWNIILGLIFAIYLLANKETFAGQSKKIIYAIFTKKRANTFIKSIRYTGNTFNGFLSGKLVDSLIIGLLCFIGTTLLNIPYPILISVIIGITNIIPFFGPYLGAIPSALLILMVSPIHCLYFVVFIILLQQLDGNVIGPKILGESTGLTGFWVLFSITVFGGLFGVFGMVIGVPTFAVIYALIRNIIHAMLKKKNMPLNTREYIFVDYVSSDLQFIPLEPNSHKSNKRKSSFLKFIAFLKEKRKQIKRKRKDKIDRKNNS